MQSCICGKESSIQRNKIKEDYDWKERSDHSRERFLWMQESKIYHD